MGDEGGVVMFMTSNTAPRPMFATRSRLAVARDIAIVAVCIGIVLGFLMDVWSPSVPARNPVRPIVQVAMF